MADAAQAPGQLISLPQCGGAMHGLGEKFAPDLHTGTGNFSVPLQVPPGRSGMEPKLELVYSTGNGNGLFGLGWGLDVPGVSRKTSHGLPRYDDSRDVFILSGAEDLVPVERPAGGPVRYRPRTEGLFARVEHHRDRHGDLWRVTGKDGVHSRYGTPRPEGADPHWRDPAATADPDDPSKIYAWSLTRTTDPLGNTIVYEYDTDQGSADGHRWRVPLLRRIRYADYEDEDGATRYLVTVTFYYEDRPDPFSYHRAGFEIRTVRRCRSVTTAVAPGGQEQAVRRYELHYEHDPFTSVSMLERILPVGFDDIGGEHRPLPPLEFGYTTFAPEERAFQPVTGADLPAVSLAGGERELVDITGDGLPDLLELTGTARYWRNLGDGSFDHARTMAGAPAGLGLNDPGVQLLDADGDGRADLMVTRPGLAGCFPLRFDATWGRIQPYRNAPTFSLQDPEVRLLDLNGDGVTGALRAGGPRLECWFNDPETGWSGPEPVRHDTLPAVSFTDPRVRIADLTGDGLPDLVMLHNGDVRYWPCLGRGRWGGELRMAASPRLPYGHDPRRVLLGDVNGDGLADLVYVADDAVHVWFNRSGNSWSEPVVIKGTPAPGPADVLRIVDLLGTGSPGILWSREATAAGRPAMYFLDLTGEVAPRLLERMENGLGATTRVGYRPSTHFSRADDKRAATRWRTPLPVVVPVVERVEFIDAVSRSKLTTTYHYRHGYWDGREREFRGFGCVEQRDTETFEAYNAPGLHTDATFHEVERGQYAASTLTRTWFHPGPVESADGDWQELDLRAEHWPGDPSLLGHTEGVDRFLRTVRDPAGRADRRARADALRALRGSVLRTELYALDGSPRQDRPYTVSESAYGLREESPPTAADTARRRVYFPFLSAQRTTQWERGDDPLTQFAFTGDHDAWGQPRRGTTVAPPRRSARRRTMRAAPSRAFAPDETEVLATHTRTVFAGQAGGELRDRVAQTRTYELVDAPGVLETAPSDVRTVLADQALCAAAVRDTFDRLSAGTVSLISHAVHHYDGMAYRGLPVGELGEHGLLTRSEALIFTDECLDAAYKDSRPAYLGGSAAPPAGSPPGFGAHLGYRRMASGPVYEDGWYADTLCQAYDMQLSTADVPLPAKGLTLGVRDALGHETRITPDTYWLLPATVRDPAGLTTTAEYDYRAGRPSRVTDANGNTTHYRYHPLGPLAKVFLEARDGTGGTEVRPETAYTYDFTAFTAGRGPVNVRTVQRVWLARDNLPADATAARDHDETIETREYSDGFGRSVQKRVQADELAFGADGDDSGVPAAAGAGGPAIGSRVSDRVVVSGWAIHDNKGRVVEKYEPFYDAGWVYRPEARYGSRITMTYDPRGQLVGVRNPDGSQRRTVYGTPEILSDPDGAAPSPWTMTAYDENDLAPVSSRPDGTPLIGAVPASHHWTPTTTVVDALGRTLCQLVHGGADPVRDGHATRTSYDIRGNILAITDELGRSAFWHVYDLAGRLLRVVSIDAGVRMSVPDATGALVASEDARRCVTLRTYDDLNRPTAVYARDTAGARLTMRERLTYGDSSGARDAAMGANLLGRLWRHLDEAGLVTAERYDAAGALVEQLRKVVSDTAIAAAEPDGWTADWAAPGADSALEQTVHRTSTRHDALGRAVLITAPEDVEGHRARIRPQYSRSGALRSVSVDGTPYVRLLAHNARGQRMFIAYGMGAVTRYAYDPYTYRLSRLRTERMSAAAGDVWTSSGPALQDLTYGYDLKGNVTGIEERTKGCGVAGTAHGRDRLVREFGYDSFDRLTWATGRACKTIGFLRPLDDVPRCGSFPTAPNQTSAPQQTAGYRETYTYDESGNVLDLLYEVTTGTQRPRWHRAFTVAKANNWLESVANGAEAPLPFTYDASGNMETQGDARVHQWDHAGRLVGFRVVARATSSIAARYLYGADGVRVKTWVRRGAGQSHIESTTYLDGLAIRHGWSTQGGGANTTLRIVDGTGVIASVRTGHVSPDEVGPSVSYELADHLGNCVLTLDDAGSWGNREEYFPYGETSFGSFRRKRDRFVGKPRDAESGAVYVDARYLAPFLCRWLSCDPALPGSSSLYAYARNSPLCFVDPDGAQDMSVISPGVRPPPPTSLIGEVPAGRVVGEVGERVGVGVVEEVLEHRLPELARTATRVVMPATRSYLLAFLREVMTPRVNFVLAMTASAETISDERQAVHALQSCWDLLAEMNRIIEEPVRPSHPFSEPEPPTGKVEEPSGQVPMSAPPRSIVDRYQDPPEHGEEVRFGQADPYHHLRPQQFKEYFDKYKIDIHERTVQIDLKKHQSIHPKWNESWWWVIINDEAAGYVLSKADILRFERGLARKFGIDKVPVVPLPPHLRRR